MLPIRVVHPLTGHQAVLPRPDYLQKRAIILNYYNAFGIYRRAVNLIKLIGINGCWVVDGVALKGQLFVRKRTALILEIGAGERLPMKIYDC
jgi:hypothetical protein